MSLGGDQTPHPPGRGMLLVQDHKNRLLRPLNGLRRADYLQAGGRIVHVSANLMLLRGRAAQAGDDRLIEVEQAGQPPDQVILKLAHLAIGLRQIPRQMKKARSRCNVKAATQRRDQNLHIGVAPVCEIALHREGLCIRRRKSKFVPKHGLQPRPFGWNHDAVNAGDMHEQSRESEAPIAVRGAGLPIVGATHALGEFAHQRNEGQRTMGRGSCHPQAIPRANPARIAPS
ncbi:hypothetical protein CHELA40_12101 [Chelatococcus asaccharovorans]|nr:hypothetical protein CHELA40_12101 [Chelatococcus asaccharovorans]CAH1683443.1 hypothetical protein CHELA17_63502 [Chelatococcus asaccharovorans]